MSFRRVRDVTLFAAGLVGVAYGVVTFSWMVAWIGVLMVGLPAMLVVDKLRGGTAKPIAPTPPRPDADVAQYLHDEDRAWLAEYAPDWRPPDRHYTQAETDALLSKAARLGLCDGRTLGEIDAVEDRPPAVMSCGRCSHRELQAGHRVDCPEREAEITAMGDQETQPDAWQAYIGAAFVTAERPSDDDIEIMDAMTGRVVRRESPRR